jgi:hypothetical protein
MKTRSDLLIRTSAIVIAMGLTTSGAFAAEDAFDTAANYAGGWSASTTPNLGTGFGSWTVTAVNNNNPPYSGTYLDETGYGNPDAVLSGGYAWGTYANSGPPTPALDMVRAFNTDGSSTSLVNQTFSVALGSGGIGGAGSYINLGVGTAFNLAYTGGGSDNFTLSVDGGAANPIPVAFAQLQAGIDVAFTVTGPANSSSESYSLSIAPFAGGPAIYTGSGTFDSSAFNTSDFSFVGSNTSNDQFVNNLSITSVVPEPSSLVLLGFTGIASLRAIRRRK